MDEVQRILKMLEEGKISPEEAIKLIEAVKKSATQGREGGPRIPEFSEIMDTVGSVISEALGVVPKIVKTGLGEVGLSAAFSEKFEMRGCGVLELDSRGSTITLKGEDTDFLTVKGKGPRHRAVRKRDVLGLTLSSCEAEIHLPREVACHLSLAGSELTGDGLAGKLSASFTGSDVSLEFAEGFNSLRVEAQGSDLGLRLPAEQEKLEGEVLVSGCELRLTGMCGKMRLKGTGSSLEVRMGSGLEELTAELRSSSVLLSFPSGLEADLELVAKGGHIRLPKEARVSEESAEKVRAALGEEPEAVVKVVNEFGSIEVRVE